MPSDDKPIPLPEEATPVTQRTMVQFEKGGPMLSTATAANSTTKPTVGVLSIPFIKIAVAVCSVALFIATAPMVFAGTAAAGLVSMIPVNVIGVCQLIVGIGTALGLVSRGLPKKNAFVQEE